MGPVFQVPTPAGSGRGGKALRRAAAVARYAECPDVTRGVLLAPGQPVPQGWQLLFILAQN